MFASLASCNFTGPGSGKLGDYSVKIVSYDITKDKSGKDAVIINYEWKNNSHSDSAFFYTISNKVLQNGVECKMANNLDDSIFKGYTAVEYIKPGKTLKVQLAYALQDMKTPINVELQEAANKAADAPKVTRTFKLG